MRVAFRLGAKAEADSRGLGRRELPGNTGGLEFIQKKKESCVQQTEGLDMFQEGTVTLPCEL